MYKVYILKTAFFHLLIRYNKARIINVIELFLTSFNHQLLRLNLIIHLYTERHQTDVERVLGDQTKWKDLTDFIIGYCNDTLLIIDMSGEPHVVTRHGTFVQQYLTRVNQVTILIKH